MTSLTSYKKRSNFMLFGLFILFVVSFSVQSAQVQGAESKSDRATSIQSRLKELGYSPSLDSDGDVVFKADDVSFCIILDEDDDRYYRVTLPNIDELDEDRMATQLATILSLNTKCKGVKFFALSSDKIWISVEGYYSSTSRFNKVLPRIISTVKNAYMLYGVKVLLDDD